MINQLTLIIGANSDIGKAIAAEIVPIQDTGLILISREITVEKKPSIEHGLTDIKKNHGERLSTPINRRGGTGNKNA